MSSLVTSPTLMISKLKRKTERKIPLRGPLRPHPLFVTNPTQ